MDSNFKGFSNAALVVLLIITRNFLIIHADECSKTSACSCQYSDGAKVDLSPLTSNTGDPT